MSCVESSSRETTEERKCVFLGKSSFEIFEVSSYSLSLSSNPSTSFLFHLKRQGRSSTNTSTTTAVKSREEMRCLLPWKSHRDSFLTENSFNYESQEACFAPKIDCRRFSWLPSSLLMTLVPSMKVRFDHKNMGSSTKNSQRRWCWSDSSDKKHLSLLIWGRKWFAETSWIHECTMSPKIKSLKMTGNIKTRQSDWRVKGNITVRKGFKSHTIRYIPSFFSTKFKRSLFLSHFLSVSFINS